MSKYFITSDWHLNHSDCDGRFGILNFERDSKFSTIQEHDEYIVSLVEKWLKKLEEDDTFYFLGDFGRPDSQTLSELVRIMGAAKCHTVAVRGNHDHEEETEVMKTLFDEVHDYPIWINKRVVLSHCPCNVWRDQLNVHGHLHGAILNSDNHLCASIHVANYQPIILSKHVLGVSLNMTAVFFGNLGRTNTALFKARMMRYMTKTGA